MLLKFGGKGRTDGWRKRGGIDVRKEAREGRRERWMAGRKTGGREGTTAPLFQRASCQHFSVGKALLLLLLPSFLCHTSKPLYFLCFSLSSTAHFPSTLHPGCRHGVDTLPSEIPTKLKHFLRHGAARRLCQHLRRGRRHRRTGIFFTDINH